MSTRSAPGSRLMSLCDPTTACKHVPDRAWHICRICDDWRRKGPTAMAVPPGLSQRCRQLLTILVGLAAGNTSHGNMTTPGVLRPSRSNSRRSDRLWRIAASPSRALNTLKVTLRSRACSAMASHLRVLAWAVLRARKRQGSDECRKNVAGDVMSAIVRSASFPWPRLCFWRQKTVENRGRP